MVFHNQHHDATLFDHIQQRIGELVEQNPPNAGLDFAPLLWGSGDERLGVLVGGNESTRRIRRTGCVPFGRLAKLDTRFGS